MERNVIVGCISLLCMRNDSVFDIRPYRRHRGATENVGVENRGVENKEL